MKRFFSLAAASLILLAGLCVGCGDKGATKPENIAPAPEGGPDQAKTLEGVQAPD